MRNAANIIETDLFFSPFTYPSRTRGPGGCWPLESRCSGNIFKSSKASASSLSRAEITISKFSLRVGCGTEERPPLDLACSNRAGRKEPKLGTAGCDMSKFATGTSILHVVYSVLDTVSSCLWFDERGYW